MMDSTASLNRLENLPDSVSPTKSSHRGLPRPHHQKPAVEPTEKQFALEEFDNLHVLGRGSFGQVTLVRHRKTD